MIQVYVYNGNIKWFLSNIEAIHGCMHSGRTLYEHSFGAKRNPLISDLRLKNILLHKFRGINKHLWMENLMRWKTERMNEPAHKYLVWPKETAYL